MRSEVAQRIRDWTDDDDALLGAILALGRSWSARNGRVTLTDLGLDSRLATFVLSGVCPRHGQFVREWTGRATDVLPIEARCSVADRGRCHEVAPVFVLV